MRTWFERPAGWRAMLSRRHEHETMAPGGIQVHARRTAQAVLVSQVAQEKVPAEVQMAPRPGSVGGRDSTYSATLARRIVSAQFKSGGAAGVLTSAATRRMSSRKRS